MKEIHHSLSYIPIGLMVSDARYCELTPFTCNIAINFGGNVCVGDRVVAAALIACGQCWACKMKSFSLCETTNPSKEMAVMYNDRFLFTAFSSNVVNMCFYYYNFEFQPVVYTSWMQLVK